VPAKRGLHAAPAARLTRDNNPEGFGEGGGSIFSQPPLQPCRDHADPYRALLEERVEANPFFVYWRSFVDPHPPVAIQKPGWKGWRTYADRRPEPPHVWAHLRGVRWAGGRGRQYVTFVVFDFDAPKGGLDAVLRLVEKQLGLVPPENCLPVTSPSWDRDRSFHLFVPVLYRNRCPTLGLARRILEPAARAVGAELYPHERRIFRYPFGRGQHPILAGVPYHKADWREALAWLFELEPVELKGNPHLLKLAEQLRSSEEPPDEETPRLTLRGWCRLESVRELYLFGIPEGMTRYEAQFWLFVYFYRQNVPLEAAVQAVKSWIRVHHNGRSRSVLEAIRTGNWRRVDRHIERQGRYVYEHYWQKVLRARRPAHYPDGLQWLEGWVSREDMAFIAQVYRGDIVNQRRLFELIAYMRPRLELGHEWVYVPCWRWEQFAPGDIRGRPDQRRPSRRAYPAFRADLEARGLLQSRPYRHVDRRPDLSHPARYRLALPPAGVRLEEDGRPITDFVQAAVRAFGGRRAAAEALGLPQRTAYAVFDLGFDIDRLCLGCGAVLEDVHASKRYCSDACRKRHHRLGVR